MKYSVNLDQTWRKHFFKDFFNNKLTFQTLLLYGGRQEIHICFFGQTIQSQKQIRKSNNCRMDLLMYNFKSLN